MLLWMPSLAGIPASPRAWWELVHPQRMPHSSLLSPGAPRAAHTAKAKLEKPICPGAPLLQLPPWGLRLGWPWREQFLLHPAGSGQLCS